MKSDKITIIEYRGKPGTAMGYFSLIMALKFKSLLSKPKKAKEVVE